MSVRETLCAAIRQRRVVEFGYGGRTRRVEPYAVWRDEQDEWQLDGWSLGYSQSQSEPGWRCYTVSEVLNVTMTTDEFSVTRPDYNPIAPHYGTACCRVA